jgi:ATP-dependent DNA helicase RecG
MRADALGPQQIGPSHSHTRGWEMGSAVSLPEWADAALSAQLPILRDRGEGQSLEFMARYPDNGYELSKEIAAFASSNAGTILIGISDDGAIAGLTEAITAAGRDALCRRIEGVCAGNVKPAITPVVKFAIEAGCIVLVIEIPRGPQPVYYSRNTPYVRHLSQSRPAEPTEVIERVDEWRQTVPGNEGTLSAKQLFRATLLTVLIEVLVYGEELEQRDTNPWFDLLLSQLHFTSGELRRLAADDCALEDKFSERLEELANLIDRAVARQMTLGGQSWEILCDHIDKLLMNTNFIITEVAEDSQLTFREKDEICELLRKTARQLYDLDRRADEMANDGRIEQLQAEASRLGGALLRISYRKLDFIKSGFAEQLRSLARVLHLLETERLYLDGGASIQRVLDIIHGNIGQLVRLLEHL